MRIVAATSTATATTATATDSESTVRFAVAAVRFVRKFQLQ